MKLNRNRTVSSGSSASMGKCILGERVLNALKDHTGGNPEDWTALAQWFTFTLRDFFGRREGCPLLQGWGSQSEKQIHTLLLGKTSSHNATQLLLFLVIPTPEDGAQYCLNEGGKAVCIVQYHKYQLQWKAARQAEGDLMEPETTMMYTHSSVWSLIVSGQFSEHYTITRACWSQRNRGGKPKGTVMSLDLQLSTEPFI